MKVLDTPMASRGLQVRLMQREGRGQGAGRLSTAAWLLPTGCLYTATRSNSYVNYVVNSQEDCFVSSVVSVKAV